MCIILVGKICGSIVSLWPGNRILPSTENNIHCKGSKWRRIIIGPARRDSFRQDGRRGRRRNKVCPGRGWGGGGGLSSSSLAVTVFVAENFDYYVTQNTTLRLNVRFFKLLIFFFFVFLPTRLVFLPTSRGVWLIFELQTTYVLKRILQRATDAMM